jgi:hypothetical protein
MYSTPPNCDSTFTTLKEVRGAAGPADASDAIPNPTTDATANDDIPNATFLNI